MTKSQTMLGKPGRPVATVQQVLNMGPEWLERRNPVQVLQSWWRVQKSSGQTLSMLLPLT